MAPYTWDFRARMLVLGATLQRKRRGNCTCPLTFPRPSETHVAPWVSRRSLWVSMCCPPGKWTATEAVGLGHPDFHIHTGSESGRRAESSARGTPLCLSQLRGRAAWWQSRGWMSYAHTWARTPGLARVGQPSTATGKRLPSPEGGRGWSGGSRCWQSAGPRPFWEL